MAGVGKPPGNSGSDDGNCVPANSWFIDPGASADRAIPAAARQLELLDRAAEASASVASVPKPSHLRIPPAESDDRDDRRTCRRPTRFPTHPKSGDALKGGRIRTIPSERAVACGRLRAVACRGRQIHAMSSSVVQHLSCG